MNGRNESLDCLKGVAILLVMFGHVQVHNQMTDPYIYDVIKSLQMPLFFLVSGYLAGAGTKVQSWTQYKERVGKRACAYLLPFFSWIVVQHVTDVPRALKMVIFQLDCGLWFLMAVFLFAWMTYTAQLVQAGTGREWMFWLVFLGSGGLVLTAYLAGVTFLSPSILIIYLPYYISAYFIGMYPGRLEGKIPMRWQRILAYAGGMIFLGMAAILDLVTVTGLKMLMVQMAASFLGCFSVVMLVLDWKDCRMKARLAGLGRYTLEIYVLHYQFARVLNPDGMAFEFWSFQGLAYSAAAFAAMSALTAVCIVMIDHVPALRLFLFGKRGAKKDN